MKRKKLKRAGAYLCAVACLLSAMPFDLTGKVSKAAETKLEACSERTTNQDMKLWYQTPANINTSETNNGEWMQQSLPLGNGDLGNLIFGGISKERIHFNEKSLWTGGPSDSRPGYNFGNKQEAYTSEEIEEYRKVQDDKSTNVFNNPAGYTGVGQIAPIRFPGADNVYKGEYQDFGDIWLDYSKMQINEKKTQDYRRELDLQTGVASTEFTYKDVTYRREHFVSEPDNVMVTYLTADEPGNLSVGIMMELNNSGLTGKHSLDEKQHTCTIEGNVKDNGLKFYTTMKVIPTGGTIRADGDNGFQVTDADSILIIMAAETDYLNDYPTYRDETKDLAAVVDGRVEECGVKSYQELKDRHIADHQELFDRVSLDLGESYVNIPTDQLVDEYRAGNYTTYLETLAFQYGRYLSIAGSRGYLPSNLVGLWTIGPSAWTGDYHFNINVQMNYWPVYVTNLAECGTTFVEYMESLREPGRITAQYVHGITDAIDKHTGFTVHTVNNPFGMTAPTNNQEYGWNPTGAAWAIQNIWQHYEFTQDKEYLENTIYPTMKEAALFWDNYLWESDYQKVEEEGSEYDSEKRLVVAPSISAEQGPTAMGTTYDQSLVWELYKECIKAGELLGEAEEQLHEWQETMQRLDPININATNGIKEWYEETRVGKDASGHNKSFAKAGNLAEIQVPNSGWNIGHPGEQRHASHLVGLYPGTLISKENEEYMDAAVVSLTERGEYSTGWSKANKINLWARTGDGDQAYKLLNNLIGGRSSGLQYNLFGSHGSQGGDTMMNGSPVWQIDCNYGLTAGVAEMLIQSQLGYTQFLPAIPEAWEDGEVQGLKARGNFTIGETWRNGLAETFTVCYEGTDESSQFIGEYEDITGATVCDENGNPVTDVKVEETNGRIEFTAVQGETYTIDLTAQNNEELKGKAQEFLEKIHPDLSAAKTELENAIRDSAHNLGAVLQKVRLMDEIYRDYLETEDVVYYLTEKEGLSENDIDSIYIRQRTLRTALLANDQETSWYETQKTVLKEDQSVLDQQMENRVISFDKESGPVVSTDTLTLGKSENAGDYKILYTMDGSEPNAGSTEYISPISLDFATNTMVRAALFLGEQRVSPVYTRQYTVSSIDISGVTADPAATWGDKYAKEKMIDNDHSTRWASKQPGNGGVTVALTFDEMTALNRIDFDLCVSNNNAIGEFEIQAKDGESYKTVYAAEKMGDINDKVGAVIPGDEVYHAYYTAKFDTVETTEIRVVMKGYTGEPSLFEVEPLLMDDVKDTPGEDVESLNQMIKEAKEIDKQSTNYLEAPKALKDSFELAIKDAEEKDSYTQAEMDSREEFLRSRYDRLGFGETDKAELGSLIEETETKQKKDYTRDSWYLLQKALVSAKETFDDAEAKQPAVDRQVTALKKALNDLETSLYTETSVAPSQESLSGNFNSDMTKGWAMASGYMATRSDSAGVLTFKFTGNGISVLTVKDSDHGTMRVVIRKEGVEEPVYNEVIDTYVNTGRQNGALLFEKMDLEDGTYTVTFERTGHGQASSSSGWVEVGTLTTRQRLEEKVNRNSLQKALDACEGLLESDYTADTWASFIKVYTEALELMAKEDGETCTSEMKDMEEKLAGARGNLMENNIDLSALQALLEQAEKITEDSGYTAESYNALRECILEIKSFMANANSQSEVDQKVAQLQAALDGLVPEKSDISTAVLRYALELASTADTENVVESVKNRFETALANANLILAGVEEGDPSITQTKVDDAWRELIQIMQYLSFKQGDKTDLAKVIALAEEMNAKLDSYLDEGKATFTEKLKAAQDVYADGDAMQGEVDTSWKELLSAMSALQIKPDKSLLSTWITQAQGLDETLYESDRFAAVTKALTKALAVYEDEQATETQVLAAAEDLKDAMAKLTPGLAEEEEDQKVVSAAGTNSETKTAETGTTSTENSSAAADTTAKSAAKSAKTGDTFEVTNILGIVGLAAAAMLLAAWRKRKIR